MAIVFLPSPKWDLFLSPSEDGASTSIRAPLLVCFSSPPPLRRPEVSPSALELEWDLDKSDSALITLLTHTRHCGTEGGVHKVSTER